MARSSTAAEPLTPPLLAAVRAQLAQGERIAWAAGPEPMAFERKPARIAGKWDAFVILGLGYTTIGAIVMGIWRGQWFWLAAPASLLLLGLAVYAVNAWLKARADKVLVGTVYSLTTRRALILRTYPSLNVQALPLDAIAEVTMIDKRGPFADIALGPAAAPPSLIFRGIPEPERARNRLLRVIRDPAGTDEEIAASESYLATMRQLMNRSASN